MTLWSITEDLADAVDALRFGPPVTHVYNPLRYARQPHRLYLERWGREKREALFLGMNPGPWGMAQTGIPFGEVALVRDWLDLEAPVEKPPGEHPKRPIDGFQCTRSEVSGRRLWGWIQERFSSPERFFEHYFVGNYCPLIFLEESGRNRTPDRLPAEERVPLFEACDEALRRTVAALEVTTVIGIGRFARDRAKMALAGTDVNVVQVLHPSPASPAANRGWAPQVEKELKSLGLYRVAL